LAVWLQAKVRDCGVGLWPRLNAPLCLWRTSCRLWRCISAVVSLQFLLSVSCNYIESVWFPISVCDRKRKNVFKKLKENIKNVVSRVPETGIRSIPAYRVPAVAVIGWHVARLLGCGLRAQ